MRSDFLTGSTLLGVLLSVGVLTSFAPRAHADDNDLVLSRLAAPNATDTDIIPDNQSFRSLASELGVAIAPKFLTTADTLGFSGFQFDAELGWTGISGDAPFWCATEETTGCNNGQTKSGSLSTVGVFARKGIWLPIPSFEIGAGFTYLNGSRIFAGQAYGKFALHEGFHDWPIPSVAVRGAVSRLLGSEQIDLTVASVDVSVSKRVAIEGTFSLTPYAGFNWLWMIPRSEVIDFTPQTDALTPPATVNPDIRNNFVFPDQDDITRQRLFFGLKFKHYVFALTAELAIAFAGSSVDNRAGIDLACGNASAAQKSSCDAHDEAAAQKTFSLAAGLDF